MSSDPPTPISPITTNTALTTPTKPSSITSPLSSLSASAAALLSSYVDATTSSSHATTPVTTITTRDRAKSAANAKPKNGTHHRKSTSTATSASRPSSAPRKTPTSGSRTPQTSSRVRSGTSTPGATQSRQSIEHADDGKIDITENGNGHDEILLDGSGDDLSSNGEMHIPTHFISPLPPMKSGTHTPRTSADGVTNVDVFALRRQVEDARSQYDWMAKAYKKREKEWKSSEKTIAGLKLKITTLQTELEQTSEIPKKMLEQAQQEITSLNQQLSTLTTTHQDLLHSHHEYEEKINLLTTQDITSQQYITTLNQRIMEANEQDAKLQAEYINLMEEKNQTERELENVKKEREERYTDWIEKEKQLNATIASLESRITTLTQELDTARSTITSHEQAHATTQSLLSQEQSQHHITQQTLTTTTNKLMDTEKLLSSLRDTLTSTLNELTIKNKQYDDIQQQLNNEKSQHAITQQNLNTTQQSLEKEQIIHTETRNTLQQTSTTLKSEQTSHQQTQQMLTSIKQQLVTTQQSLNTLTTQHQNEIHTHHTTRQQLENIQLQHNSTQNLLKSSQDAYSALQIELQQQQEHFITERTEMEAKFAAFREESAVMQRQLTKTNQELTKSVEEAKDKFSKYAALLESRNKESDEMRTEADRQIRELKSDITHLHENLSILGNTCHDMNQSMRSAESMRSTESTSKSTIKKPTSRTLTKEQIEQKQKDDDVQTKLEAALAQIRKTETHLENQKRQWTEKEYVYEKRQHYWQEHNANMQGNMAQLLEQIENLENRCLELTAQLMKRQAEQQLTENEEIKGLENKIIKLEQTLEETMQLYKMTRSSLTTTTETLESLTTSHRTLSAEHDALDHKYNEQMISCEQHTHELQQLQIHATETKQQIETTTQQLTSLRTADTEYKSVVTHDITTLTQQLAQAQQELLGLRSAAEHRSKIVAEAQTKYKLLKPYVGMELAPTQNRILKVIPSSSAHHSGILKNDIIISVNGVKSNDIGTLLKKLQPGTICTIEAMRDNHAVTFQVEVSSKSLPYSSIQRLLRISQDVVGADDAQFLAMVQIK